MSAGRTWLALVPLLPLLAELRPFFLKKGEARWRYANERTAIYGRCLDESAIAGILPDCKSWA